MCRHDKKEIEKLKRFKQEYLKTKDQSKEEKIKNFLSIMRGDK